MKWYALSLEAYSPNALGPPNWPAVIVKLCGFCLHTKLQNLFFFNNILRYKYIILIMWKSAIYIKHVLVKIFVISYILWFFSVVFLIPRRNLSGFGHNVRNFVVHFPGNLSLQIISANNTQAYMLNEITCTLLLSHSL